MRAVTKHAGRWAVAGVTVAAAVWIAGCANPPKSGEIMPTPKQIKAQRQAQREARQAAAKQAARLAKAMNRGIASTPALPAENAVESGGRPTEVVWDDPADSNPPPLIAKADESASANASATAPQDQGTPHGHRDHAIPNAPASIDDETSISTSPKPKPVTPPLADLPRAALVAELGRRIRGDDPTPVDAAVRSMLLSIADATQETDPAVLKPLSIEQRERLAQFQEVVLRLKAQLATSDDNLDRDKLAAYFDQLFGTRPISINRVELCKRVRGFGVYNPFSDHTFLAGQDHRMIVYTELSNFQSLAVGGGQQEVALQQHVMLFTDSDGLIVWRHDPVKIVDHSRNKRHDFFTIEMVTLPARLTVGKYRLKVSVTDQHGGSVDETTIPLTIVADPSLAAGDGGGTSPSDVASKDAAGNSAGGAAGKLDKMGLIRELLGTGNKAGGQ